MKNTVSEVKNTLIRINNRFDSTDERISTFEDTAIERSQMKYIQKKKIFKHGQIINELWDNSKRPNIFVTGVPKRGGEQKYLKK